MNVNDRKQSSAFLYTDTIERLRNRGKSGESLDHIINEALDALEKHEQ